MNEEFHHRLGRMARSGNRDDRSNSPLEGPPQEARSSGDKGREDIRAWERLLEAFQEEYTPISPPPWLEDRVMAEILTSPEPGPLSRLVRWFLAPRPIRISPLSAGLAAAGLGVLFFLVGTPGPSPTGIDETGTVYVQFALEAPNAISVSVAGDFNGWNDGIPLADLDGDGIWTGRVPVEPGVHAYMFLVDGTDWRTDPRAERYSEDGFGNRNAILAVAPPSA